MRILSGIARTNRRSATRLTLSDCGTMSDRCLMSALTGTRIDAVAFEAMTRIVEQRTVEDPRRFTLLRTISTSLQSWLFRSRSSDRRHLEPDLPQPFRHQLCVTAGIIQRAEPGLGGIPDHQRQPRRGCRHVLALACSRGRPQREQAQEADRDKPISKGLRISVMSPRWSNPKRKHWRCHAGADIKLTVKGHYVRICQLTDFVVFRPRSRSDLSSSHDSCH